MRVSICAASDAGMMRTNNEDSVRFDAATGLCLLADGMGGHNAGEVASGMATAFLHSELTKLIGSAGKTPPATQLTTAIADCISRANGAIYTMAQSNARYAGMGTTLVLGMFLRETLVLAHIGDSRCYRWRDGQLQQMTKDHSVLQEQIDAGLQQSPLTSTLPNLLTRGLGTEETVAADIAQISIAAGDIYLMCSDGLTDMLSDAEIAATLSSPATLADKAQQLIAAANAAGGHDNVSVLLAQVDPAHGNLLDSAQRMLQKILPGLRGA